MPLSVLGGTLFFPYQRCSEPWAASSGSHLPLLFLFCVTSPGWFFRHFQKDLIFNRLAKCSEVGTAIAKPPLAAVVLPKNQRYWGIHCGQSLIYRHDWRQAQYAGPGQSRQ